MNRAANAKDVEHKTTKKTNQESALTAKKADLEGTQKELDAALAYYDKLKPSCVDAGVSYEDRVARRKEEIEYPNVFYFVLDRFESFDKRLRVTELSFCVRA